MSIWFLSVFLLAHPLNFFEASSSKEEVEDVEEMDEEEEDVLTIPILDRESET
jgi:hypothetical protein